MTAGRLVVGGALAAKAGNAGEAWVRLSWVRALASLGFDVRFVEELADPTSEQRAWFDEVIAGAGLAGRAVVADPHDEASWDCARDWLADCDALVNVSGNLRTAALRDAAVRRVYVDLDPAYTQIWHADGLLGDQLEAHHHHATVGLSVGSPRCPLPTGAFDWLAVVPPTVLDDWNAAGAAQPGRFTTVGTLRGAFGRLDWQGTLLGQRLHELRAHLDLPRHLAWATELAITCDPADRAELDALAAHGWQLTDPAVVVPTPEAFRTYVQASSAELAFAQGAYVQLGTGWVSDRSMRYLAAGRPVLVQDTGLPAELPRGAGFVVFSDFATAVRSAEAVAADYEHHCRAASAWAAAYSAPGPALAPLLERVDVAP